MFGGEVGVFGGGGGGGGGEGGLPPHWIEPYREAMHWRLHLSLSVSWYMLSVTQNSMVW